MKFENFSDIANNLNYCNWPTVVKSMIALSNHNAPQQEKDDFFLWFKQQDWSEMNSLIYTSKPSDHFSCFENIDWQGLNPTIPYLKSKYKKYGSFKRANNIFKTKSYRLGYWDVKADIYETKNYVYICLPDTITKAGQTSLCEMIITLNKKVYNQNHIWLKYKLAENHISIDFQTNTIFDANSDYF